MKMNYVTKELFSMLPKSTRELCSEFCDVMEYELDINQYSPPKQCKEESTFGFAMCPSENSKNSGGPCPISVKHKDFVSLSKSLNEMIDELLERLGETRTSLKMKAQLFGISK